MNTEDRVSAACNFCFFVQLVVFILVYLFLLFLFCTHLVEQEI